MEQNYKFNHPTNETPDTGKTLFPSPATIRVTRSWEAFALPMPHRRAAGKANLNTERATRNTRNNLFIHLLLLLLLSTGAVPPLPLPRSFAFVRSSLVSSNRASPPSSIQSTLTFTLFVRVAKAPDHRHHHHLHQLEAAAPVTTMVFPSARQQPSDIHKTGGWL